MAQTCHMYSHVYYLHGSQTHHGHVLHEGFNVELLLWDVLKTKSQTTPTPSSPAVPVVSMIAERQSCDRRVDRTRALSQDEIRDESLSPTVWSLRSFLVCSAVFFVLIWWCRMIDFSTARLLPLLGASFLGAIWHKCKKIPLALKMRPRLAAGWYKSLLVVRYSCSQKTVDKGFILQSPVKLCFECFWKASAWVISSPSRIVLWFNWVCNAYMDEEDEQKLDGD